MRRNKYGAERVYRGDIKFDSKLERSMHDLLTKFKIPFVFQYEVLLQPPFTNTRGKKIRAIKMLVDFVVEHQDKMLMIDTKGMATEVSKIKYKMLDYHWHVSQKDHKQDYEIIWLRNKKEVQDFVIRLYDDRKQLAN